MDNDWKKTQTWAGYYNIIYPISNAFSSSDKILTPWPLSPYQSLPCYQAPDNDR